MCDYVIYFSRVVREDFHENIAFEQGHEQNDRESPVDTWGSIFQAKTSSCKGPGVEAYLTFLRNSKEVSGSEVK